MFRRYLKVVEWSDEDACYIGSAPPLLGQCCHGDTEGVVMSGSMESWKRLGCDVVD
jgi:predicted RNase H-like HicB family nuclease